MTVGQFISAIYGMTKICIIFRKNGDFCERIDIGVNYEKT